MHYFYEKSNTIVKAIAIESFFSFLKSDIEKFNI